MELNRRQIAALVREALEMAERHPSKDARFFAHQVGPLLGAMADKIDALSDDRNSWRNEATARIADIAAINQTKEPTP